MHPLVGEHLDWLALRNLSATTIRHRRETLERVFRQLGADDPRTVTVEELTALQKRWRVSPSAHCTYASHLRAFYAYLMGRGEVAENPALGLVLPKVPQRVPRPIPEKDLRMILSLAPRPVRTWLILGSMAGLRACECAALRREDLLFDQEPPVLLVRGKGGKQRVVVANDTVRSELASVKHRNGWLFTKADGEPLRPNRVTVRCSEWLHENGWPYSHHQARHTFLTRLYQQTLDIRLCQTAAGHASPAVTAHYAAFSPGKMADAVRALDALPVAD